MIPIFEQGGGKGIGHSLDSFLERFDNILEEHRESGRATAFAFVIYNFEDREFKKILNDQGTFAKLDRLSGNKLSIFFLHSGSQKGVRQFNENLLDKLNLEEPARTPCVVFCRSNNRSFYDIEVIELDSANLIHGLQELYSIIEDYIDALDISRRQLISLRHLQGAVTYVSKEVFQQGLRLGIEAMVGR